MAQNRKLCNLKKNKAAPKNVQCKLALGLPFEFVSLNIVN